VNGLILSHGSEKTEVRIRMLEKGPSGDLPTVDTSLNVRRLTSVLWVHTASEMAGTAARRERNRLA
jgi:hypothetical protein